MNNRDKILNDIEIINGIAKDMGIQLELVIIGGSAFVLQNMIDRATRDIDIINTPNKDHFIQVAIAARKYEIDINNRARIFKWHFIGWEKELVEVVTHSNVVAYTLSKEMLIVSKFFTRLEDRDITNAAYDGLDVSQNKIEEILINIWKNINQVSKKAMRDREMEIIEFYRTMGWNYETSITKKLCQEQVK